MTYAHFETISIGNVRVHICSIPKFKTTTLSAFIQQDLVADKVTKTALLPSVMQRGTVTYPSTIKLKRKLDEMYGAILFGDVFKRGENHIIQFGMEIANEQYLRDKKSLLEGITFFSEVLTQPFTENGAFHDPFVQAEKKNLKQKIESLQDDKIRYAAQRMIEVMCENEPYALFNHGRLEDLPTIDANNLYTYYQEFIQTAPLDIYCVGNVSTDQVIRLLTENVQSRLGTANRKTISVQTTQHSVKEEKVFIERLDVKQGKLNMGCRTQTFVTDPDYPALLLYNGVLGGFPHSKLFMNVREKASLAYYCSSKLESHKGLLTIQSGIEIANYDKAVKIIKQQLEAMKQGDISDKEIEQTKATLSNQFREQQDRSYDMINFHYHTALLGQERSLEQLLDQIAQVKKEDIQKVAEKIKLDTIYFLRDQGGPVDEKNRV